MRVPGAVRLLLPLAFLLAPLAAAGQPIEAGGHHNCVLATAGGFECSGYNNLGQLGNGSTT